MYAPTVTKNSFRLGRPPREDLADWEGLSSSRRRREAIQIYKELLNGV